MKVKRNGKEETVKGVDTDVSEGEAGADDLGVVVHDMDDKDDTNFGSYTYGDKKVNVYPANMKGKNYTTNLVLWIEKTTAHEVGHYACADDLCRTKWLCDKEMWLDWTPDDETNGGTGRTIYNTAILSFNIDGLGPPDLMFTWNSDLSGLLDTLGRPLYPLNKPGTGFTTAAIPAPGARALALIGLVLLPRRTEV